MTDNKFVVMRQICASGASAISGDVICMMSEQPIKLRTNRPWVTLLECGLILTVSLLAEMTHFSAQQGRAVICADSAQYVASAEALVYGDQLPHFEMRKPGYSLLLAGILIYFGKLGWIVVIIQHVMLALLPIISYAMGRILHSRMLGWLAAAITLANLQATIFANRIMSECLFACLLSAGLLLLLYGMTRVKYVVWFTGAGMLLGLAWLTRGNATAIIAAAVVFIVYWLRADRRKLILTLLTFGTPIAMCVAFECGMNGVLSNRWRPSNGTAGALLTLRMRYYDGVTLPNTIAAAGALRWLPERTVNDAYLCSPLDVWIARYRAIHDGGMNEWTYDDLMAEFGKDMVLANLGSYVKNTISYGLRHFLRQPQHAAPAMVLSNRRKGWIAHASSLGDDEAEIYWYAYWGHPHRSLDESKAFVDRMKLAASTRAPIGDGIFWKNLRYFVSIQPMRIIIHSLQSLGKMWPILGVFICVAFGVDRKLCTLIVTVWLAEAFLIGLMTPTLDRLQFVWIGIDATMTAAILVLPMHAIICLYKEKTTSRLPESNLATN